MTQRTKLVLLVAMILVQAASAGAITRAARKAGFLEFRGSYAMPQGEYDGVPGIDFLFETELVTFDAERVYHDGFGFGLSYGQLIDKHWLVSLGFDYTTNKIKRPIVQQIGNYEYTISMVRNTKHSSYDLTLRTVYSLFNPVRHGWSPYGGLSAVAGLTRLAAPDIIANNEFAIGLNLDFGLDVKIWAQPDSRQFVTLSSINSWNFYTTKERVSNLQVGAGIKYFFGP